MNATLISSLDLAAVEPELSAEQAARVVKDAVTIRMQTYRELRDPALAGVLTSLGRGLVAASDMLEEFGEHAEGQDAEEHAAEYRELIEGLDEALDRIDAAIRVLNPDADAITS